MAGYQKILHEASVNFSACASGAGPSEEERKAAAAELLDRVSHVQVPLLLLTSACGVDARGEGDITLFLSRSLARSEI